MSFEDPFQTQPGFETNLPVHIQSGDGDRQQARKPWVQHRRMVSDNSALDDSLFTETEVKSARSSSELTRAQSLEQSADGVQAPATSVAASVATKVPVEL